MNKQQGFTLIELMIVVAIIGILAAIAIPAYRDYIARSQVSEAVVLLDGAKTAVEEQVAQTGTFPADTAAVTALGVVTTGKWVNDIAVGSVTSDGGTLTATMKSTDVSTDARGKTIAMIRSAGGGWHCAAGASNGLPAKYLPQSCR